MAGILEFSSDLTTTEFSKTITVKLSWHRKPFKCFPPAKQESQQISVCREVYIQNPSVPKNVKGNSFSKLK